MSIPASPVSGSCLCGAVRYRAAGPFEQMAHCHCSRCRRAHGAAFATYVAAPAAGLEWLAGRTEIREYQAAPGLHRYFCGHCGSVTAAPEAVGNLVFMPAGNLQEDCGTRPVAHIFADSRAPWIHLDDTVPAFAAAPPGYQAPPPFDGTGAASTTDALTGGCLCGQIRYRIEGQPVVMVNCHCSRCRRARSAAHATNLFVLPEQLTWTAGADLVRVFDLPGAKRFGQNFCPDCGSPVPRPSPATGRVNVPAGSLDGDPGVAPALHIYVASKAPWFDITDDAPRHDAAAPA